MMKLKKIVRWIFSDLPLYLAGCVVVGFTAAFAYGAFALNDTGCIIGLSIPLILVLWCMFSVWLDELKKWAEEDDCDL